LVNRAEKLRSTASKRAAKTITPPPPGQAPAATTISRDVALEGAIAAILRGASMDRAGITQGKRQDEEDEEYEKLSWFKRRYGTAIDLLCSQMVRVILALIVLGGFVLWWKQNSGERAAQQAVQVIDSRRELPVGGQLEDWKRAGQNVAQDAVKAVDVAG